MVTYGACQLPFIEDADAFLGDGLQGVREVRYDNGTAFLDQLAIFVVQREEPVIAAGKDTLAGIAEVIVAG